MQKIEICIPITSFCKPFQGMGPIVWRNVKKGIIFEFPGASFLEPPL